MGVMARSGFKVPLRGAARFGRREGALPLRLLSGPVQGCTAAVSQAQD